VAAAPGTFRCHHKPQTDTRPTDRPSNSAARITQSALSCFCRLSPSTRSVLTTNSQLQTDHTPVFVMLFQLYKPTMLYFQNHHSTKNSQHKINDSGPVRASVRAVAMLYYNKNK
jgi:hypothetical protein